MKKAMKYLRSTRRQEMEDEFAARRKRMMGEMAVATAKAKQAMKRFTETFEAGKETIATNIFTNDSAFDTTWRPLHCIFDEAELPAISKCTVSKKINEFEFQVAEQTEGSLRRLVEVHLNANEQGRFHRQDEAVIEHSQSIVEICKREALSLHEQGCRRLLISELCGLTVAQIDRLIALKRKVGTQEAVKRQEKKGRPRALSTNHLAYVKAIIRAQDGFISLRTVKQSLATVFPEKATVAVSTIARSIRRDLRLSKRKVALRNPRVFRGDRTALVRVYLERLLGALEAGYDIISVDEAAVMVGSVGRTRWHDIGEPNIVATAAPDSRSYTLLFGVSMKGVVLWQLIEGACNSFFFSRFISGIVHRFGGKGVLIQMDNASVHKSGPVKKALFDSGLKVIFPPAYYPEGVPVELAFALIKSEIVGFELSNKDHLLNSIYCTMRSINPEYCRNIFKHCIYQCAVDSVF